MKKIFFVIGLMIFMSIDAALAFKFFHGDPKKSAERIAAEYMKDNYGYTGKPYEVGEGVMLGAEYSVRYRISDDRTFSIMVSTDDRKVVYDNYITETIMSAIDEEYEAAVSEYWDKETKIIFDYDRGFMEDEYLNSDKSIDIEKAKHEESFCVRIMYYDNDMEEAAKDIYSSVKYLTNDDIKLDTVVFYDRSEDGGDSRYVVLENPADYPDAESIYEEIK